MSQEVPLLQKDLNCFIFNQSELNQQNLTQTSQDSIENAFNPYISQQVNESGIFNVSHSSHNKQDSFAVNFNSFCQEQKYNREFLEQEDLETPKCLRPLLKPVEQYIQETRESKKKVVKQRVLSCLCSLFIISLISFIFMWFVSLLAATVVDNIKDDLQKYFYNS